MTVPSRPVCVFCACHRPGQMLALVDLSFDDDVLAEIAAAAPEDEAVCFYCAVGRLERNLREGNVVTLTVSRVPAEVTV